MNLNGKITNPGELRTLVTVQLGTVTKSADGVQKIVYANLTPSTAWVKWMNAHGIELIEAQSAKVQAPATVLMRYRSDINTRCALVKDGLLYAITSIDDIQNRHEYLEVKCILTAGTL